MQYYWFGTLKPVYFKLVDSNGDGVTGENLVAGDALLYVDGALWNVTGEIGTECSEVGSGWYKWTPTVVSQTQGEIIIINIKDLTVTPVFIENGLQLMTGGHPNAFLDATGT